MSKRSLSFLIIIPLLSILLSGCAEEKQDTVIWQVSDIHYIAPELIEDRSQFESTMSDADGKVTQYIEEITDSFIAEALSARPDAVIISGDLTLNGARASHEQLAAKLSELTSSGIRVLVIPGNHDITRQAYRFVSDGVQPVESVSTEEFRDIYKDFGFSDAIAADERTLSYVSQINDNLRILMVDVNTAELGSVPIKTLRWIDQQLSEAENDGTHVIAVSHQNLFIHNKLFNFGYQINNSEKLADLYEKHHVPLNLSGHLHIQHISSERGIKDIATSSLSVFPNQYGILTIGDTISYRTQKTNINVLGIDDFYENSSDFFDGSNSKFADRVPDDVSAQDRIEMIKLAEDMNRGLFSGYIAGTDEAVMEKWESVQGFSSRYLSSMLPGIGIDYNTAEIYFEQKS